MSGELRRPSVRLFPTDQVSSNDRAKILEKTSDVGLTGCEIDRLTGWLALVALFIQMS